MRARRKMEGSKCLADIRKWQPWALREEINLIIGLFPAAATATLLEREREKRAEE